MLKASTIACPKCATRLRVRSLDAVSESDACPECGAPLRLAADQQSADLHAAEAEPRHPALATSESDSRRPGPAGIAATVTGLLGLVIVVPLLLNTPESKSEEGIGSTQPEQSVAPERSAATVESQKKNPGRSPGKESRPVSTATNGRPSRAETGPSAVATDSSSHLEVTPTEPFVAENADPPKPSVPDISIVPSSVKVAGGEPNSNEKSPIQQASGTREKPADPGDEKAGKTGTVPAVSRPTVSPPPTLDERLDVSIAKFELKELVTLQSLLETVEIMAELHVELSPGVSKAISDREVVFSLENTSPRGILNEAAKRTGLVVSVTGDRVTLKPADR